MPRLCPLALLTTALGCNVLAEAAMDAIGERSADHEPTAPSAGRPPSEVGDPPAAPEQAARRVGRFETIIAGSKVTVPPFLGDDAFSIPITELKERLGLTGDEVGGEAACAKLGPQEPVCAHYRLDQALRPSLDDEDIAALPVDAVELSIHPPETLQPFLDLVRERWGDPIETRSRETMTKCHNDDCKEITGYPLYYWFDDEAGLGMRVEGAGVYVIVVFFRYLPTAKLPAAFADAVRPHLGKVRSDDGHPGAPSVEIPGHKWDRPGEPATILWQAQSFLGGPSTIHSFWLPIRYHAHPDEVDVALDAMRDTWGKPQRGCSRRDPTQLGLRFSTDPPIVAIREDTALSLWAFADEDRADRELVGLERCKLSN